MTTTGTVAPGTVGAGPAPGLIGRLRRDAPWWLLPVTVVAVLGLFGVYAVWTAVQGWGATPAYAGRAAGTPYLSPFYSPTLFAGRTPVSPAFWVLWSPLLFRATCYYYRKAYYRSFFWDPPACAVGEARHRRYRGESAFPLILNNLHRFFLYVAVVVLGYLWYDVLVALRYAGGWYLGLGTLIFVVNVVLLSGYTFSCHSLRHMVGGRLDCFSCVRFGKQRHGAWRFITRLNERHPMWAWVSLFSVLATDIYIRIINAGFHDPHITF